MAQPPEPANSWQRFKRLPDRTPLRVKLTAAVLVLVTAALALISTTGIALLRDYLLNQADQALSGVVQSNSEVFQVKNYLLTHAQPVTGYSVQWLPTSGPVEQTSGELSGYTNEVPNYIAAPGPTVRQGASWLNQGLY